MSRIRRFLALVTLACPLSVATLPAQLTVPERTKGERTSSHAEVLAFIDSLLHHGARMQVGTLGESPQGRRLPYVILSRPLMTTPAAAKASGKPLLYIQANIHAGEVEGKEAVQMLMRDLTLGKLRPLLDSVIILFVPIYNADGNDNWGPQARHRSEQLGPAIVGTRANGQGYDLNRDYVKQEAPETRASLAFIAKWDPDLFMDLHTTDGSYHGYALTWSPGLNQNRTPVNSWVQDTALEQIRRNMRAREHFETYPYGNFMSSRAGADSIGWATYEPYPRYGTNLQGMVRASVLSEAYSHDPFPRRIDATYAFVLETIRYLNEHKRELRRRLAEQAAHQPDSVAVRSAMAPPRMDTVLTAVMRTLPVDTAARIPGGQARQEPTGKYRPVYLPVFDRFVATRKEAMPAAYLLDPQWSDVVALMRRQGIVVEQLTAPWVGETERFAIDTVIELRFFEGHRSTRLDGEWGAPAHDSAMVRSYVIPTNQRMGMLAAFLLEPASEDGYVTWNFFDHALPMDGRGGMAVAPIRRMMTMPAFKSVRVP